MTIPASPSSVTSWRHENVLAGGMRLHVVRAGEGPAVVLLHGFPDFWLTWRYQIDPLVRAGFSVVAPDMRGYNTSEKPAGIAAYDIDELVVDVAALIDRTCGGRAFVVGHDWGGIVAWYAAMRQPGRIAKLAIVNAPHPALFARDFWSTSQWLHSLYGFFFQLPRAPEALLRARRCRAITEVYRRDVRNADAFAHGEPARYREAMSQPGALTGGLNYYRALRRRTRRIGVADVRPIEMPALVLWGERDRYLNASLSTGLDEWVTDLEVKRVPDAGHWLHLDEPQLVNDALIEFFRR